MTGLSAANYVAAASAASLFVIRASDIVQQREGDTGLGQYAWQWKKDHEGIGAQLSMAGRRLNLLPPAALPDRYAAMLEAIRSSGDPTSTYLRMMKAIFAESYDLHQKFARHGASPTLRPVGAMAAPILLREQSELRRR